MWSYKAYLGNYSRQHIGQLRQTKCSNHSHLAQHINSYVRRVKRLNDNGSGSSDTHDIGSQQ
jgi:hypothetical protein